MNTENTLIPDIKTLIVDTLELEDVSPEDIDTVAPLFKDGLGLDSIDALELGIAIQKKYGVVIDSETETTQKNFFSVKTLAEFVAKSNTR